MPVSSEPKAYFLTWRTYGTWLPGDERGWVGKQRTGFGEPKNRPDARLEGAAGGQMKFPPFVMTERLRRAVELAIRESCGFRAWTVVALNVRTNHVHLVVTADKTPDDVLKILKSRVTGSLRSQNLVVPNVPVWSRGGSHRILWKEHEVDAVVNYTLNRQ